MLNQKRLYIIVSDYPYGNGEPFLEDELNALAKKFDKVSLIITNAAHLNDPFHKFSIPDNVELKFYIPENNLLSRIRGLWFAFAEPSVKEELNIIRKNYKQPLSLSRLRLLFSYIIHGLEFRNYLEKLINHDNTHKASNYLYTYWCTYFTFGLALLKKDYKNINAFTRVHRWDLYMNVHMPSYLPFRKFIIDQTDKIFSVSEDGKRYLTETIPSIDKDKISVNFLGTTIHRFPNIIKTDKKLCILSIAFISKVKRVDLLVDTISLIKDFDIEWHHIGGGADEAQHVEHLSKKLLSVKNNISYKFYGNLSKNDIYHFLDTNNIHVLVNTSWSEGLPVSIMEAMSYGIPVIATDVGGNREIVVNGENGILLSSNPSKEEVADALKKIWDLSEIDYKKLSETAFNTWNTKFNNVKNNALFIEDVLSLSTKMYKVCSRCILDNIDYPEISFDEKGVCNICQTYDELHSKNVFTGNEGEAKLSQLINKLKSDGKNKEYDCILGVSGGVDSTYLALKAKEWGLRPLLVHIDNGWNSELAVNNIENIVKKLGFDLFTTVINWKEIKDLQLSYLKASVVDIDIPTDNTFVAALYNLARKKNIKHILSGYNIVTEGWMPQEISYDKYDMINLKDIHNKFGSVKLKTFPTISKFGLFYHQQILGIKSHAPLNYINYNKAEVKQIITQELGWRDYGGKHYENIFTRFYQGFILPEKFGIDKRKFHLSTLICSGQIDKETALSEASKPLYNSDIYKTDREFFLKKIGISNSEFENILAQPVRKHSYYRSYGNMLKPFKPFYNLLKKTASYFSIQKKQS